MYAANGACGWYTVGAENERGVGPNDPDGVPIYCDLLALRDTHGG